MVETVHVDEFVERTMGGRPCQLQLGIYQQTLEITHFIILFLMYSIITIKINLLLMDF